MQYGTVSILTLTKNPVIKSVCKLRLPLK